MGFPQNLLSIFSNKASNQVITARAPLVQKALINQYSGRNNPDVNLKNAEQLSCVYLCIKILAEHVSRLPINIYQEVNGKKNLNQQHEHYQSLRFNPKPYLSSQQWLSTIVTHLFLRGNAYSFIRPDGSFEIIHPDYVTNASIVGDTLWYLVETPDPNNPNSTIDNVVKYSDLLHFRLISKDSLFGLNPIDSLRIELNTDYKSISTVNNFFSQNAQTTKYLEQNADLGKLANTKIAELVEKFQNDVAGYENAGQLWTVPLGMSLKELKLNVETVQFLEASKISKATIASIFGVPLYLLNQFEYTTKFEEQYLSFLQSLNGVLAILRSELENKLLTMNEKINGVTIEFEVKRLNETNQLDKANIYKTLFQMGAVTPNQVAKEFNLEQNDNPNYDKGWIQSQNIPLDDYTPATAKTSTPPNPNNTNE